MTRHRKATYDRAWSYSMPSAKPPVVRGTGTSLVRLDTARIRAKALKDFSKAEDNLEKLKSELKAHEERNIPDFKSWLHRTFAAVLTKQRELAQAIKEKQSLLFEIQDVALRFDLSDVDAYRKAIHRRAHPEEAEEEDRIFYEEARRMEEEQRAAQEQHRRRNRHSNDDHLDDFFGEDPRERFDSKEEWDEFSDFIEDMTGYRPPEMKEDTWRKPPPEGSKDAKDVYRTIVRQLHPDMNGQMDDTKSALWHEAQDAYRRNDLAALHNVLGRCKGEDRPGSHSPVGLILMMTQHLKKSARALRADIQNARQHPAWDFVRRAKSPAYVNRIRCQLEDDSWRLNHELRVISQELQDLERQATRIPPKRRPHLGH